MFFLWEISSLVQEPLRDKERVTKYEQYFDTLSVQGLNFPLSPKQIPLFEQLNPEISISLYSLDQDNKRAFNIECVSPHRHRPRHVNLLLLKDDMNKHYAWIRDMSRLVSQRSKHDQKCHVCNIHFWGKEANDNHLPYCLSHPVQQVIYPNPDDHNDCTFKFRSIQKQHRIPFYLVCDFESFIHPFPRKTATAMTKCVG